MSARSSLPLIRIASVFVLLQYSLVAEPRSIHSRNSEPREHHLFVGAELFIQQGEDLVTVERIRGDAARIQSPTPDYISLRKTGGIHWRLITKVSAVKAEIEKFDAAPYSSQEMRDFADQAATQSYLATQQDMATASQSQLQSRSEGLSGAAASNDPEVRIPAQQEMATIESSMAEVSDNISALDSIMESSQLGDFGESDRYDPDSLDISFRISSPTPLAECYVFISMRVAREGKITDTSFYRHLSNIGPKPRKVRFTHEGFPTGFEIKDTKVYLFSYGEEIATNLSEKHYQLTYDEAKEFLQLSHIGEHRRETIPAQPAWSLAPPSLLSARDHQSFDYPIQVDLDANGKLLNIRENNQIVPETVRDLLTELTFIPALENGTPVPSTLTINPADFYKN